MTDTSIILSIKNGSTPGYEMLMKKHYGSLLYFLYRMVNNYIDAEDLTLETFTKAFSKLDSYTPSNEFSTWLYRIAKNTAIDYLRTKDKRPNDIIEVENLKLVSDYRAPEEELISSESIELIEKSIEQLSPKARKVMKLHVDGYSDEEITEETGLMHGAVRSLLCRARKQLKDSLYE